MPEGHFAPGVAPAFEELIRQAAQGDVVHNDDTTVKILELMGAAGAHRRVHVGRGRHPRRPAELHIIPNPARPEVRIWYAGKVRQVALLPQV